MTEAQRAHERLMQSLPVRTHKKEEKYQDLDPYTGKPKASPLARRAIMQRHYFRKAPAWSLKEFEVVDGKVVA
jgi:hypothetical protein